MHSTPGTSTIDRYGCPDGDSDGFSDPDGGWPVASGAVPAQLSLEHQQLTGLDILMMMQMATLTQTLREGACMIVGHGTRICLDSPVRRLDLMGC